MGLLPFVGSIRRLKRMAFVLFVVCAVYAGPRFARDLIAEARNDTPTTSSIPTTPR